MALKKSASSTVKNLYTRASQNYSAKLAGSKSLLYNKYVLYAAFAVCLINILSSLFSGNFMHIAIFLLAGYTTTYFSKNMIVILVIALVVSNVITSGTSIVLEGMETKGDDKKKDGDKPVYHKKGKKEGFKKKARKEGMSESGEAAEGVDDEAQEGVDDEAQEGVDDETQEGVDDKPCTIDADCGDSSRCSDNFICVAR